MLEKTDAAEATPEEFDLYRDPALIGKAALLHVGDTLFQLAQFDTGGPNATLTLNGTDPNTEAILTAYSSKMRLSDGSEETSPYRIG